MNSNLEKQIKRHVVARRHEFYAVTTPGLEKLCAGELTGLPLDVRVDAIQTGGVLFSGRLLALYGANLMLRSAGRILLRLARFKATNFRQLEKNLAGVAWRLYLPRGCVPSCKVTARQSRLYHTQAVAEHVTRIIEAYWRQEGHADEGDQEQTLFIRIQDDSVTLSLDSSGPNLYLRGIKTHAAAAPVRETLAASILQMAGYDPARPLLDPMAGAGTFALEAALWAKQIPPGAFRDFAFMRWPAFREPQWRHLKSKALANIVNFHTPTIFASDVDPKACERLTHCVDRHHLNDIVTVQCTDFFDLKPPQRGQTGLVVLNPPYGRRLSPDRGLAPFFHQIGRKISADFKDWRLALLAPLTDLARQIPFPIQAVPISHGGLALTLFMGRVPAD